MIKIIVTLGCLLSIYVQAIDTLTNKNIPFVYESRAEIPTSDKNLAKIISMEYKKARDEFTQYELMEKIKPIIKSKFNKAKANNNYSLRIGSKLGKYNFANNTFPTGFSQNTFIPFKNGYALTFNNGENIETIAVPFSEAKKLSTKLQRNRDITAIVYFKLTGVEEKKINWNHNKILKVDITKITILSDDGNEIISTNF